VLPTSDLWRSIREQSRLPEELSLVAKARMHLATVWRKQQSAMMARHSQQCEEKKQCPMHGTTRRPWNEDVLEVGYEIIQINIQGFSLAG